MKNLRSICILWVLLLLTAGFGYSQSVNATLLGTVTDSSGAVVPNAKIVLTEVGTGVNRSGQSNESGNYTYPNLPPGQYSVTVEAAGFKKETRKDIAVLIRAPAANCSGYVMSPPGFGRFSIARAVSVVAVFGFSGLSNGACSCTTMLSLEDAMFSRKSTVCFCPSSAMTELFCWVAKRSASTFTAYAPGLSCGKLNRPEPSVFADRFRPFSVLAMVTIAPGMAAPVGSVTDPTMALVVSPCALAGVDAGNAASATAIPTCSTAATTLPSNLAMPKSI